MDLNAKSSGTFYVDKAENDWLDILDNLMCLGFTVEMTATKFKERKQDKWGKFPPKRVAEIKFHYYMDNNVESEEK